MRSHDDPYSTALALQALAKVQPNLAVIVNLSKSMPPEGEAIAITPMYSVSPSLIGRALPGKNIPS